MKCFAKYLTQTLYKWNLRTLTIAAVIGLVVYCSNALAQSGAGSIQGTVTDMAGAAIPAASIHVAQDGTGAEFDTKSNGVGFYQVPGLFTGTYVVTVSAPGMGTYKRTIELLAAQNAVISASLKPGTVTQQVSVTANTVQLTDPSSGTITATLENARINELPMNGRSVISLVGETTPGFENCTISSSCANGGSGAATEYVADGASLTNRNYGGVHSGTVQMLDPDSVQQVQVEDVAAAAQYASPATVILTTKSGTNHVHGTLFETARNNAFGIARSRSNPSNYAAPQYIRNEFGISAGGPVIIPHVYDGKNKTFWFFAYERYSLAQQVTQNQTVPTQAMRNGDFSGLVSSSNILQQLYNPYTTNLAGATSCREPASVGTASPSQQWCRQPFANNFISPSLESPTAVILNEMTALPTNANNPLVASNQVALIPEFTVEPQFTIRLDHSFNESNRVYLRFTRNVSTGTAPHNSPANEPYSLAVPSAGIPAGVSGIALTQQSVLSAAIGYTHVFSSTFYSETVLADSWSSEQHRAGGSPTTNWESQLGLPNNFGAQGFPYFESLFQPIDGTMWQYGLSWTIPEIDENLTKVLGRHQLQFGGRFRFEGLGSRPDQSFDEINFASGEDTGLYNPSTGSKPAAYANTGQLNADEFLGGASSYQVTLQPPYQHFHDMEFDGYIQDNYRIRHNLTFNLGLRWEAHPAVWEGQGAMEGFDLNNHAIVTSGSISKLIAEGLTTQAIITNDELDGVKFETASEAGLPPMLTRNYNYNFSPRVGAAWQAFPQWGTVVRGGIGRYIYANPIREAYRNVNLSNNPFVVSYSNSYTSAGYAPDNTQNYLLRSQPATSTGYSYANTLPGGSGSTPVMGVNSGNIVNSTSTTAITPGLNIVSIDPSFPPSFMDEANFTIEQPLKWNSVLRVSYIYTHGTNLNNSFYFNDWPSEYSWEVQTGTPTPTGTASVLSPQNSGTGEGPYDNLSYGNGIYRIQKSGWSNYHGLQANFQRLFNNGYAWQVIGVWSKSMRTGGDFGGSAGDNVDPYADYVNSGPASVSATPEGGTLGPVALPPPPPTGVQPWQYYKALNRWENYMVDVNNPWLHVQFNGLVALPFGQGKRWLGSSRKALNEVVGGWQIAGAGSVTGEEFPINTTNWGPTNSLQVYKHHSISDCRSGVCLKSMEWFNGYIAPTAVAGNACAGALSTVVNGLPSNWAPYQAPIDTICSGPTGGKANVDKYFGDNDVIMNGVTGQSANTVIPYGIVPAAHNDNGVSGSALNVSNPFGRTTLNGPNNYSVDLSLFKLFPLTEGIDLRVNVDAFNAFNIQGFNNPSSTDGTSCYSPGGLGCSSHNTPRQLQFSARLTF
jgi:Carboxypeptidase regulatory-like domain